MFGAEMKIRIRDRVLAVVLLLCALRFTDAEGEPIKMIGINDDMEKQAGKVLAGCPLQSRKPHAGINKNGVYTLVGDLSVAGRGVRF
jgi:hypothetical protein